MQHPRVQHSATSRSYLPWLAFVEGPEDLWGCVENTPKIGERGVQISDRPDRVSDSLGLFGAIIILVWDGVWQDRS